ncbi:MAG: 2-hydroxyacid dehydrogenase [Candidatus Bathyarchaeota archaeon]|nr:2-hydroxyacid dehydrogenase [Candidatus Bathyarchaeota archaeon]
MKILVVRPTLAERIREHLPDDIEVLSPVTGTDDELEKLAADVEIIVSTRLSASVIHAASKLKLLQKTGAGVDDMPFDALREDTWIANTSGSNPVPLAEGAVAFMLALAKRIVDRHNAFPQGRGGPSGIELRGRTAGIIGLGSIGIEVGKRLHAFGMRIMGVRRSPDEELRKSLGFEFIGGTEDLHHVLSESDFVVVTVPLTPDTRGMIGEDELGVMKPSAFIVNVARAAIIQEEPLYRALKEGRLAGAALDVWWKPHWWDPLWHPVGSQPSEYPFWELPNVICTPHNVGSSDVRSDASIKVMVENILRVRDGKPPINQVDKRLRY